MISPSETNKDGQITGAPADVQWMEAAGTPAPGMSPDGQKTNAPRRFQMNAYTGGPMQLAGWRYPVVVDMAGMQASVKPKVFLEHDRTQRVGHIDQVQPSESGLAVSGVVSSTGRAAQEVIADASAGFPWQASMGARATEVEWVPEGKSARANGREFQGPVNIARKSVLGEVSFVAMGADDATTAQIAAQAAQHKEQTVMENPTPPLSATEAPAPIAASAAPVNPAPQTTTETPSLRPADQMRAEAAAESLRIAAVRKACGGKHGEIEAKAIAEGWDATRAELEVLRAGRPAAPAAIISREDRGVTAQILQAACFQTAKLAGTEKLFDAPTLEAADRKFHGSLGLQELLLEAAWANGYTGRNFRDSRAVMQYAFADIRAEVSTVDIGGILSNVANKFLLEGFSPSSASGATSAPCATSTTSRRSPATA